MSPVAYIPIGTLEWHGIHGPVGADGIQDGGITIAYAQNMDFLVTQ